MAEPFPKKGLVLERGKQLQARPQKAGSSSSNFNNNNRPRNLSLAKEENPVGEENPTLGGKVDGTEQMVREKAVFSTPTQQHTTGIRMGSLLERKEDGIRGWMGQGG